MKGNRMNTIKQKPSSAFLEIAREHYARREGGYTYMLPCPVCGCDTAHRYAFATRLDEYYTCLCGAMTVVRVR